MAKTNNSDAWLQEAMEHMKELDDKLDKLQVIRNSIYAKVKDELDLSDKQISSVKDTRNKLLNKMLEYLKKNKPGTSGDTVFFDKQGNRLGVISVETKPGIEYSDTNLIITFLESKGDDDMAKSCVITEKKLNKVAFKKYLKQLKAIYPGIIVPGFDEVKRVNYNVSTTR